MVLWPTALGAIYLVWFFFFLIKTSITFRVRVKERAFRSSLNIEIKFIYRADNFSFGRKFENIFNYSQGCHFSIFDRKQCIENAFVVDGMLVHLNTYGKLQYLNFIIQSM